MKLKCDTIAIVVALKKKKKKSTYNNKGLSALV